MPKCRSYQVTMTHVTWPCISPLEFSTTILGWTSIIVPPLPCIDSKIIARWSERIICNAKSRRNPSTLISWRQRMGGIERCSITHFQMILFLKTPHNPSTFHEVIMKELRESILTIPSTHPSLTVPSFQHLYTIWLVSKFHTHCTSIDFLESIICFLQSDQSFLKFQ